MDVSGRRLGVVGGLGTSLDVGGDTVVVARREQVEVVQALEGDCVLRSAEANCRGVARHLAFSNIVRSLSTKQETITADDGVCGERGALNRGEQLPPRDMGGSCTLKRSRKARVWRPGCL